MLPGLSALQDCRFLKLPYVHTGQFKALTCGLVGPHGGRRGERAALHAGGELPYGERHRAELGRHEAPVGLHIWAREAQYRHQELQDFTHRASHESNQKQREDRRGKLLIG